MTAGATSRRPRICTAADRGPERDRTGTAGVHGGTAARSGAELHHPTLLDSASERRLPAGIDRREAVETARIRPSSRRHRYGNADLWPAPMRGAQRNRTTPSFLAAKTPRSAGFQPASTAERRSKPHHPARVHDATGTGTPASGRHPLRAAQRNRTTPSSLAARTPRSAGFQPASTAERRSKPHHSARAHDATGTGTPDLWPAPMRAAQAKGESLSTFTGFRRHLSRSSSRDFFAVLPRSP